MPIYEYKCDNGHIFDVIQRMADDPLSECLECEAPVRKVLHPVGISFKGSGFYSTDYSKKGPKTETSSKSGDNGSNGKSDSARNGASEKAADSSKEKASKRQD